MGKFKMGRVMLIMMMAVYGPEILLMVVVTP
jgi:hypothetical protein